MWWIVLPVSVWVIYSTDHILDSFKKRGKAIIERHNFYYHYKDLLITFTTLSAIIVFVLSVLYLDKQIVTGGIILLLLIIVYFGAINMFGNNIRNNTPKEIIIAIIYTTGIIMGPLIWYNGIPPYHIIFIILVILVLAWAEGIMISWFDFDDDICDGYCSFSTAYGKENTRSFLIGLHAIVEVSILIYLFSIEISDITFALIILFIMNMLLGLIIMFPNNNFFKKNYRLTGEGVFVLPALAMFI